MEVISYEGCKSSDAVQILWGEDGVPFYLPNAFTPNGDGLNDVFKASPNGAYIYKIVYEEISLPGQSKTLNGSLILIR